MRHVRAAEHARERAEELEARHGTDDAHVHVEVGGGKRVGEPRKDLAGAAAARGRVHHGGPTHGGRSYRSPVVRGDPGCRFEPCPLGSTAPTFLVTSPSSWTATVDGPSSGGSSGRKGTPPVSRLCSTPSRAHSTSGSSG